MKIATTEHDHQKAVIKWVDDMVKFQPDKYWMLKFFYAVPNGARTSQSVANRLKAEGMKAGVPDLCLPYPKNSSGIYDNKLYHMQSYGLYIEMKSKDTKGKVSPQQQEWIDYLKSQGYQVEVCWTANEAIKVLEDYIC